MTRGEQGGVLKGRIIDVKLDNRGRQLPWEVLFSNGQIEKLTDTDIRGIRVTDLDDWMGWGEGWGPNYKTLHDRRIQRFSNRRRTQQNRSDSDSGDESSDHNYQPTSCSSSEDNHTEHDEVDSDDDSDDDGFPVTHWDTGCLSTHCHLGDSSPSYSRSPTPTLPRTLPRQDNNMEVEDSANDADDVFQGAQVDEDVDLDVDEHGCVLLPDMAEPDDPPRRSLGEVEGEGALGGVDMSQVLPSPHHLFRSPQGAGSSLFPTNPPRRRQLLESQSLLSNHESRRSTYTPSEIPLTSRHSLY